MDRASETEGERNVRHHPLDALWRATVTGIRMFEERNEEDHICPLYFLVLREFCKRQVLEIRLSEIPRLFEQEYNCRLDLRSKLSHTLTLGMFQDVCVFNSRGPATFISPAPQLLQIIEMNFQLSSIMQPKLDAANNLLKEANERIKDADEKIKDSNKKIKNADDKIRDANEKINELEKAAKSRPEERLTSMLHEELTCVVCLDTLNETVESNCCKTLCCRTCATNLNACPVCRGQHVRWDSNEPIRRLVGKLPVKCDTKHCTAWSTRADITQHKENCEYVVLKCGNRDCTFVAVRKDFKAHIDTCQHKEVECVYCHQPVMKKNIQPHETMCAQREVQCSVFGCSTVVKSCDMQQHLDVCGFVAIRCTNDGCNCIAQRQRLQEHLSKCAEAVLKCLYCQYFFKRRSIDNHERICSVNYLQCAYCDEYFRKSNIGAHHRECKQTPVPCKNNGCPSLIVPRQMDGHLNVCQWTPVQCGWRGCGGQFIRSTVAQHECSCWFRDVTCHHCGFETSRDLLDNHLRTCRRRRRYAPY